MTRLVALLYFSVWGTTLGAQVPTPPESLALTVYFSERPPFTIVDGQRGILVNLTKSILAEAGIKARFIELPSNRILELLRSGQPDALGIGWLRLPEREAWAQFSQPLYQDRPVVALMNSRVAAAVAQPLRLDTLLASGLTLGLKAGSSLGPLLDQKIRAQGLVPLETALDIPQLLKMVQTGRMDYTLLAEEEAQYLMARDPSLAPGLTLLRLTDPPPGNHRYFLYPGTFSVAWKTKIDEAIEKVRNSPKYREIVAGVP